MRDRSYAEFYALLKRLPEANKEELVHQWTDGRTTSLTEMSDKEYRSMVRGMRSLTEPVEELRKLRSQVLRQLQIYGVDTSDWDAVDAFTKLPRISGRRFCRLSTLELRDLLKKMRSINQKAKDKEEKKRHWEAYHARQTAGQLPN